jgi:hypothetical protein
MKPVAKVVWWTNWSYSRNYEVRFLRDAEKGARLVLLEYAKDEVERAVRVAQMKE